MLILSLSLLLLFVRLSWATHQTVLKDHGVGPFREKFAQLVNETLDMWHVPGLTIAVVDGENVWAEGYGIASFPDTPATPETLFYAGSTTKAFTAAVMSLLVDDNERYPKVQWDTPISQLIRTDFVLENEYATNHITIEDALSHRSGMPRHDLSYGGHYDGHKATAKDIVRALRYLPITAEPRTRFQYCNMMYVVVSHIIEELTAAWLGDTLYDRILKPLGMKSTYFSTPAAQDASEFLAMGYVYYKGQYQPVPYMDLTEVSGAGSVISNVLDYSKWLKALVNMAPPISIEGHKALRKSRTLLDPIIGLSPYTGPGAYSLGWHTGVYRGHEFFQHSGGMEAFGANVVFFPALKYGLVSFANTAVTSNAVEERLMWHLVDEKLGIPEKERFDWNTKNKVGLLKGAEAYETAVSRFYPDLPKAHLPLSLPLFNYTGTYQHPAYHNITLFEKDGNLHADRPDATWKLFVDLVHVTGDYFIAYGDSSTSPGLVFKTAGAAEFKIGHDGIPQSLGISLEPEMGISGRIWFDRI